jgi:hypothetical protein
LSYLEELVVTNRAISTAKPRRKRNLRDHRRSKMIASLEEQIELANLAVKGMPLELPRKRGHQLKTVRPRIWWQVDPAGIVHASALLNKVPINIEGRGTTIEVGSLIELPKVFKTLIKAVEAGELDQAMDVAARKPQIQPIV